MSGNLRTVPPPPPGVVPGSQAGGLSPIAPGAVSPGGGNRAVPNPPIANRALRPGIYAPVPTFFTPDEELDLVSFSKHIVRLASCGVYPVISGSTVSRHLSGVLSATL